MSRHRRGSNSNDFISQMSDDVLVKILSFLPIKDAGATSSLSTRWRFLWSYLTQLNFDSSESLKKISKNRALCSQERDKYVNQVNDVIQRYKYPLVHNFQICFYFNHHYQGVINEWLQFAINKNVEFLEVKIVGNTHLKFPLGLFGRRNHVVLLKKLMLTKLHMGDNNLEELIANCPHLETLSINCSDSLNHIRVGGRALNLKHIEVVDCIWMKSIYLSDFDLESFTYNGYPVDLRLTQLPKLKRLDIGDIKGMENNVFCEISCASSLEVLSMNIYHLTRNYSNTPEFSLLELPNVKKLRLKIGAIKYKCLIYLAYILNACPNLETFTIELINANWSYIIDGMRKTSPRVPIHPLKYLKLLQIMGYNIEIAPLIIQKAVELKKIVIGCGSKPGKVKSKCQEAARSSGKQYLESLMPRGAELVIL